MSGPMGGHSTADKKRTASARAAAARLRRFKVEERQAIDALTTWIAHPSVPRMIEQHRVEANRVVLPIDRLLTDQIQVIRFCWHVFGFAPVNIDWDVLKADPWMLTPTEMNAIERVKVDFRIVVQTTTNELEHAEVGLVPSWQGDQVVVGELLLLDIDWTLPARRLAEDLQPPTVGAIDVDASGTRHRRGTGERPANNISALRRDYESHLFGSPPRAPYAGGGTRALPEPTVRRRQALAKVLERWPDATAARICTTFGDHGLQRGGLARTPGGYLRQLLEDGADLAEDVHCPSKSTIHEDLKVLRATVAGQKPSG